MVDVACDCEVAQKANRPTFIIVQLRMYINYLHLYYLYVTVCPHRPLNWPGEGCGRGKGYDPSNRLNVPQQRQDFFYGWRDGIRYWFSHSVAVCLPLFGLGPWLLAYPTKSALLDTALPPPQGAWRQVQAGRQKN